MLRPGTENIIIIPKNKYYSKGLTKKNIYDYYSFMQKKILNKFYKNKIYIITKTDEGFILRRNYYKSNRHFILTPKFFKKYIKNGRTIEMHIVIKNYTDIAWIDIDPGSKTSFDTIKNLTLNIYNSIKLPIIKRKLICFSGKRGFHIILFLKKRIYVKKIKNILKKHLQKFINNNISFSVKKDETNIRIDLTTLKKNGSIILPYSLRTTGLICLPLSTFCLKNFYPEKAKIPFNIIA